MAAELIQEPFRPLVHRAGASDTLKQQDRQILLTGLKSTVEILAGVDGHTVYGLHLLEEAEGIRVGNLPGSAAAHHIPYLVILVGHTEPGRVGLHALVSPAIDSLQLLKALQGHIIGRVVIILFQEPEGDFKRCSLAVVMDQGGILIPFVRMIICNIIIRRLSRQ